MGANIFKETRNLVSAVITQMNNAMAMEKTDGIEMPRVDYDK